FSADQTMVLEFGHQYVRFHTNGGTLVETGLAVTGVTQANPGVLTYTGTDPANGDWVYLSCIGGMTQLNGRWVKAAGVHAGAPTGLVATPTTAVATNMSSHEYAVTAVSSDGVTESTRSAAAAATNNLTLAGNFNTLTWSASAGAARYNVYKVRGGVFAYIGQ